MAAPKGMKKQQPSILDNEVVRFSQTLSISHFNGLTKLKKKKGLSYEQDLVRIAVADLLEKNGL